MLVFEWYNGPLEDVEDCRFVSACALPHPCAVVPPVWAFKASSSAVILAVNASMVALSAAVDGTGGR